MNSKITFKRGPRPTGLYAVAHPHPDTDIKVGGKSVGQIHRTADRSGWQVMVCVEGGGGNPNCKWRNVTFKAWWETEELARAWVVSRLARALELNKFVLWSYDTDVPVAMPVTTTEQK
jgi:hypothetical protein